MPGVSAERDAESGEIRARTWLRCPGGKITLPALQAAIQTLVRGADTLTAALDRSAGAIDDARSRLDEELDAAGTLRGLLAQLWALANDLHPVCLRRQVNLCARLLARLNEEQQPRLWAEVQDAKGEALSRLYEVVEEDHYAAEAEGAYAAALRVWTAEGDAVMCATLQYHLGCHYSARYLCCGQESYAERAETAYQAALRVLNAQDNPGVWATIQANQGALHQMHYLHSGEEKYAEQAEAGYQAALRTVPQEVDPEGWAKIQHSRALLRHMRAVRRAQSMPNQPKQPAGRRAAAPGSRHHHRPRYGR